MYIKDCSGPVEFASIYLSIISKLCSHKHLFINDLQKLPKVLIAKANISHRLSLSSF